MTRIPRWARRLVASLALILLVVVAFGAGTWADQSFPEYVPVFGGQSRAQLDEGAQQQALRVIEAHYWNQQLNGNQLSNGSIDGMVQSLGDPYTRYLTPTQYRAEQQGYQGAHQAAIGVYLVFENGRPVVTGVLPNSPAQKAGVEASDVILQIDGKDTNGLSLDQTSALIDGAAQSAVTLQVQRGTSTLALTMRRGSFVSPTVVSAKLPGDILYLRIYQFGNTTAQEFQQQLKAGLPAKGVILDLREDGGGYVSAATSVVSQFLSSGEVFETKGRDGTQVTRVNGNPLAPNVPLAILVDGNTASASEITSGSLQAHGRATLVGVKTFGKGSVQIDFPLTNGGDLHLTVQHWYLPNGKSVDKGVGLEPQHNVALPAPQDMYDVATPQRGGAMDPQLQAALQVLS
ncbi:MAG: S41 family peptidase [Candidatus Dormiibacterota bacterium]